MTIKNKTNIIILSIVLVLSLGIFLIIKVSFFNKTEIDEPIRNVIKYYGGGTNVPKLAVATTIPIKRILSEVYKTNGYGFNILIISLKNIPSIT